MRHFFAVPKQTNTYKYQSRTFINSQLLNVQSNNWRVDYKMFAGVSYADIVKSKWCVSERVNTHKDDFVGSQTGNKSCSRTRVPQASPKAPNHSNLLIKRSEVHSNIKVAHSAKGVNINTSNRVDCVPTEVCNRFDVLNNIHDIESHEVNNSHDIEAPKVQLKKPNMHSVDYVNTQARTIDKHGCGTLMPVIKTEL